MLFPFSFFLFLFFCFFSLFFLFFSFLLPSSFLLLSNECLCCMYIMASTRSAVLARRLSQEPAVSHISRAPYMYLKLAHLWKPKQSPAASSRLCPRCPVFSQEAGSPRQQQGMWMAVNRNLEKCKETNKKQIRKRRNASGRAATKSTSLR